MRKRWWELIPPFLMGLMLVSVGVAILIRGRQPLIAAVAIPCGLLILGTVAAEYRRHVR